MAGLDDIGSFYHLVDAGAGGVGIRDRYRTNIRIERARRPETISVD